MSLTDKEELELARADMSDTPSRDRETTQTESDDEETTTEKTIEDEKEEEEVDETEKESEEDDDKKSEEEEEVEEKTKKPESDKSSKPRKEKYVPVEKHVSEKNKLKETITTLESELQGYRDKEKDITTDDKGEISDEVKALAEKMGIEDPQILQEIVNLPIKLQQKKIDELQAKIDAQEASKVEQQIEQSFEKEWDSFLPSLKTAFPNATPAELAEAKAMMENLAHSEDWHTYPLAHIFKLNREDFDDAVDIKTVKSPGSSKTQGIQRESKGERPKLSADPTIEEIRAVEAFYAKGGNSLELSSKEMI